MNPEGFSPDMEKYAQVETPEEKSQKIVEGVREKLGQDVNVSFMNEAHFFGTERPARFLHGFVEKNGEKTFIKFARPNSEQIPQLEREGNATKIANKAGIPSIEVVDTYQTINDGHAFMRLEALKSEDGVLLSSPELVAAAEPRYGELAFNTFNEATAKDISGLKDEPEFEKLKTDDWRNGSPEKLKGVWDEAAEKVLNAATFSEMLPNEEDQEFFKKAVTESRTHLDELLQDEIAHPENYSDKKYFVHNDATPNNIFFPKEGAGDAGKKGLILDFEYGGRTSSKTLARMTDFGNFSARCWVNPEMQRAFLKQCLNGLTDIEDPKERHKFVRDIAVFGAIYLSQYAMDPKSHEHAMSQTLVGTLKQNVEFLDAEFEKTKQGAQ